MELTQDQQQQPFAQMLRAFNANMELMNVHLGNLNKNIEQGFALIQALLCTDESPRGRKTRNSSSARVPVPQDPEDFEQMKDEEVVSWVERIIQHYHWRCESIPSFSSYV
jgi:hypothetical protein